jgi:hypothetical protein
MTKINKLSNGQLDLQEKFEYRGIEFTCKSWGKGGCSQSYHIVEGYINDVFRSFRSTTRKQAKDMFKKAIRKHLS